MCKIDYGTFLLSSLLSCTWDQGRSWVIGGRLPSLCLCSRFLLSRSSYPTYRRIAHSRLSVLAPVSGPGYHLLQLAGLPPIPHLHIPSLQAYLSSYHRVIRVLVRNLLFYTSKFKPPPSALAVASIHIPLPRFRYTTRPLAHPLQCYRPCPASVFVRPLPFLLSSVPWLVFACARRRRLPLAWAPTDRSRFPRYLEHL